MFRSFWRYGHLFVIILIAIFCCIAINQFDYVLVNTYDAEDFNIDRVISEQDYDKDGIDDYTDILEGARKFVSQKPAYKSKYYKGGYPNDEYAVCTDVFWYALKNAGYSFKDMIDKDISLDKESYNIDKVDSNIDFRRVKNIKVFLDKYTEKLTLDAEEIEKWQPGDIVVYKNHIAIISDKRNKDGEPYIIHHSGNLKYEENALTKRNIIGHYRFILSENDLNV